MTQPTPRKNRTLIVVIIAAVLLLICAGAVPITGILAAIAIPNFIAYQLRAKRTELPMNVEGIRAAQIAYQGVFDAYVPVPEPVPLDPLMVGRQAVPWPSGTAFDDLGWEPDGLVRGTYWVEVEPDGSDFTVHAVADLDGDGIACRYMATRDQRATMISESWVY
jgi:type IV pilus assembly protein PilA